MLSEADIRAKMPRRRVQYETTKLGRAIDKTTMSLLKEVFESAADKNVVCSPLGAMTLLAMLRPSTSGGARDQLARVLDASGDAELSDEYQNLSESLSKMAATVLTFGNKVCVSDQFTLAEEFARTVRAHCSEVDTLDFEDTANASDFINAWASSKTRGHIQEAVSPDALIDVATAAFNVIFFQGHWNVPFEARFTKDKDFHIDSKTTVKKPAMYLMRSFYYAENKRLRFRMIELPYQEEGFRMLVVLPDEIDGLPAVLDQLVETGILEDERKLSPPRVKIELEMPKFEVQSDLNLETSLRKMGVSKIFEEGIAGVVNEKPVRVSKMFQKAFIKVDEEGAKAGACTGIIMRYCSGHYVPPPPIQFTVDRPFLYLIMLEDKILFAGTFTH